MSVVATNASTVESNAFSALTGTDICNSNITSGELYLLRLSDGGTKANNDYVVTYVYL